MVKQIRQKVIKEKDIDKYQQIDWINIIKNIENIKYLHS